MIKDSISTDQRARDVQSRWLRAVSGGHEEYITRAKVQENYFKSYHWSNDELTSLADQDRPAITLNHIFNTVQTILGESTIRDMSLRYLSAGGGGDEDVAEVLSRVAHQILVHNEYQRLERKMLEDGLILDGRGYLHIKIDYEKNVLGEIKLSVIDPLSVVIDPDAVDEDPETWTEVFTFGTYTLTRSPKCTVKRRRRPSRPRASSNCTSKRATSRRGSSILGKGSAAISTREGRTTNGSAAARSTTGAGAHAATG